MKFLVTGAGGFVGFYVSLELASRGHQVIATGRRSSMSFAELRDVAGIEPVSVDLNDRAATRALVMQTKPDCAIHLAWYAAPGKFWNAAENLDCVSMTLGLAQDLANCGCGRLISAGTCAEYDWDQEIFSESAPLKPKTMYGISKHAVHAILDRYCAGTDMDFTWVRLFHIYGPREEQGRLVPYVICSLLKGEPARCTAGNQLRDFIHVGDLASAICATAESKIDGAVNVATGEAVPLRDIMMTIADIIERPDLLCLGVVPVNQGDPPSLVADTARFVKETDWKPKYGLRSGLQNTIDWWRGQNLK